MDQATTTARTTTPPGHKKALIARALRDFDGIRKDDLAFKKGDWLEVNESTENCDWWMATHLRTGKKGYISSEHVCIGDNCPQAQDWWFDIDRKEAEKMLLLPYNTLGTFLVRESQDKTSYVLCVRDVEQSQEPYVAHYYILRMGNDGFYIFPTRIFSSIFDVIDYYMVKADGLCTKLVKACPRIRPMVQCRDVEVSRDAVKLISKLGAGCFGEVGKEALYIRALRDFDGIREDDLSFKEGDWLEVDESIDNLDWWVAKNIRTGQKGYIPSNYVCTDNFPQAQDWWFDIDREEAEKMLLLPGNTLGTFLVRESHDKASYVLSVRDVDKQKGEPRVRHYLIQKMDYGGFFITPQRIFKSIFDVIDHYMVKADGLCTKLVKACPRIRPVVQCRDVEVSIDAVKLMSKLGAGCFGEVGKEALIVRALYDFDGTDESALSIKEGDRLEVDGLTENSVWWFAKNLRTGLEGYIPSNYVGPDNFPQAQDWWFDIDREEAEKMLLLPGNTLGTFLVRESQDKGSYVLSVRDVDKQNGEPSVVHYCIQRKDNDFFCISPTRIFSSIFDVVEHYMVNAHGLGTKLVKACPRIRPVGQCRDVEVSRDAVKQAALLNWGKFLEALYVRALYDFDGINEDDLSFKKGDRLEVDGLTQNIHWWVATHLRTGQRGYIPSSYVCPDDNFPQAQDWWFDIDRKEVDKMLLLPGIALGKFLVRESQDKTSYVISVTDVDKQYEEPRVRHYHIQIMVNEGFYIRRRGIFSSIFDVIDYYMVKADGLCTKLVKACPRIRPMVQCHDVEVSRDAVKLMSKLEGKLRNVVDVAVKTLMPGTMSPEGFMKEAIIMNRHRHERLVQIMVVCSQQKPIRIITELMVNGAFLDFLRKDEGRLTRFPVIVEMASHIAEAMAYLETATVVHRDLRAVNILVGEHHDVKMADFGLAPILEDENIYETTKNTKFPIKWTAPEAALERKFSIKSDVWSFGVLLYELISYGRVLYPGMSGSEVLSKAVKGYRMPNPAGGAGCSDSFYEIICKCWTRNPEQRPNFTYLHSFFDDYFIDVEPNYQEPDD